LSDNDSKKIIQELKSISKMIQALKNSMGKTVNR